MMRYSVLLTFVMAPAVAQAQGPDIGAILQGVVDIVEAGSNTTNGGGVGVGVSWSSRPANTTGRWMMSGGRKYWQTTHDRDLWIDGGGRWIRRSVNSGVGRGVSSSPAPSYHHASQGGIRWYKNDSIRWTKSSDISHMPYRYYIHGKYYAMRRQDFVSYFHQEPPAMEGNGFYPVDRVGVITTNQWRQRYTPAPVIPPVAAPAPPAVPSGVQASGLEGMTREQLMHVLKVLLEDEKRVADTGLGRD